MIAAVFVQSANAEGEHFDDAGGLYAEVDEALGGPKSRQI